jgi:hypothetical protein
MRRRTLAVHIYMSTVILVFFGDLTIYLPIIRVASARELLGYVYVGATMSDKSGDKSELKTMAVRSCRRFYRSS